MARDFKFLFKPKITPKLVAVHAEPAETVDKVAHWQPTADKEDDLEYLQGRAEQEVTLAQRATCPAVVAVHYKLAERYLHRVSRIAPHDTN